MGSANRQSWLPKRSKLQPTPPLKSSAQPREGRPSLAPSPTAKGCVARGGLEKGRQANVSLSTSTAGHDTSDDSSRQSQKRIRSCIVFTWRTNLHMYMSEFKGSRVHRLSRVSRLSRLTWCENWWDWPKQVYFLAWDALKLWIFFFFMPALDRRWKHVSHAKAQELATLLSQTNRMNVKAWSITCLSTNKRGPIRTL